MVTSAAGGWIVINSLAMALSGKVSVGLKAAALVRTRGGAVAEW
jgi:hypothetical protein